MTLQVEEARAAMLNAAVQKDNAMANLTRVREVYENNNVPLSEYEKAKNQFSAAEADHMSRIKKLDLQKRQLSYSRLYSPMSGIVVEAQVEKNENVTTGQTIATLTSGEEIQVKVGIPEAYISQIETDNPVTVSFSSIPRATFQGIITEVPYTASSSATYPVKVKLEETGQAIRPGMPAVVQFTFSSITQEHIIVPSSAVAEDLKGSYVYVVSQIQDNNTSTVTRRSITVGELTNSGFSVTAGLQEGELVVTSGVSKISDGMTVRVLPELQQSQNR
jgi:RND family efflux transporter MFP subunit